MAAPVAPPVRPTTDTFQKASRSLPQDRAASPKGLLSLTLPLSLHLVLPPSPHRISSVVPPSLPLFYTFPGHSVFSPGSLSGCAILAEHQSPNQTPFRPLSCAISAPLFPPKHSYRAGDDRYSRNDSVRVPRSISCPRRLPAESFPRILDVSRSHSFPYLADNVGDIGAAIPLTFFFNSGEKSLDPIVQKTVSGG